MTSLHPAIYNMMRRRAFNLAMAILKSSHNYRSAADQIKLLLLHDRLSEAISVAAAVYNAAEESLVDKEDARAALVHARRCTSAPDFIGATAGSMQGGVGVKVSSSARQIQLLYSFLMKWEASDQAQQRSFLLAGMADWNRRARDDVDEIVLCRRQCRPCSTRRSSWNCAESGQAAKLQMRQIEVLPSSNSTQTQMPTVLFPTRQIENEQFMPTSILRSK